MGIVISVLETSLPIFVMLGMGMLCRSRQFISRDGVDNIKKVVLNLTLPFSLFHAFASASYSMTAVILPTIVFLAECFLLGTGFLIARLCKTKSKVAPFFAAGFEAGMLGLPLFMLLFPNESVSRFALLMLGQDLFVFTLYKSLLVGKASVKGIAKDMITSPTLIAVLLGLVVGATGLYGQLHAWGVGGIVDSVTDFVSAPTAAMILLCLGYDFVPKEMPWKKTAGLIAMRLGITGAMLALLIFLNRAVLDNMIFGGALIILFILPPPFMIPVVAEDPSERADISAVLTAMTLVTMLLFVLLSCVFPVGA